MEEDPLIADEGEDFPAVAVIGFTIVGFVLSKIIPDLLTEVVLSKSSGLRVILAPIFSEASLCLMPMIATKCIAKGSIREFCQILPLRLPWIAVTFMVSSALLSLALVKSDHCVSNPLVKEPPLVVTVALHCILPALCEEFVFRGWMFHALKGGGSVAAAVITSTAFAACHRFRDIFTTLTIFTFSLCWTYANEQAKSILPGMVGHFCHNFTLSVGIKIIPGICRFSSLISIAIWSVGTVIMFSAVQCSPDKEPAALTV